MKEKIIHNLLPITIVFFLISCLNTTMIEQDTSAGFNGSFEKVIHGLPANWYIYAADAYFKTYKLIYDTADPKEGKQSLKFEVLSVDNSNANSSEKPGMFENTVAESGDHYTVSFWIKNEGCNFSIRVASYGRRMRSENILNTNKDFPDWKFIDYSYTVPDSSNSIRFELNILSPGTFWIDDVKLEKIND